MINKQSAIRRWLAPTRDRRASESICSTGVVAQLGEIKVETKEHGGTIVMDQTTPPEYFPN